MKKNYESPFIIKRDMLQRDVIFMSDGVIDLDGTGWGDFDEGGIR